MNIRKIFNHSTFPFFLSRLGMSNRLDPPNRNLNKECGYPEVITLGSYQEMFDRWGMATRVVSVYPHESFANSPMVSDVVGPEETPFKKSLAEFIEKYQPYTILERADIVSGIGSFGVIYYALKDGLSPDQPIIEGKQQEIAYMLPLSEKYVKIKETDDDPASERRGLPVLYTITLPVADDSEEGLYAGVTVTTSEDADADETKSFDVHFSRIQHLVDGAMCSDVFGVPRLRPVFNYLLDLRKVTGGSSEMFWKGAFPGLNFQTLPELSGEDEPDDETIRLQVEKYMNGLQRYIATTGMKVDSLAPQVVDPSNHCLNLLQQIAATIGVPLRILLGSEAGHLASTQDRTTWNSRLSKRQNTYVTPKIIIPFINKLIEFGILPVADRIIVAWKDLNAQTDQEKADVAMLLTQALLQYVSSGAGTLINFEDYLIVCWSMTPELARELASRVPTSDPTKEVWAKKELSQDQNSGQNRNTKPQNKKPGTDPGGNSRG